MLVSLKWLKDYVDVDVTVAELAERLTMAGLEVDAVAVKTPEFRGVHVARILSVRPHPDADRLSLCDVTTGQGAFSVVCGAPNVHAGNVVPLALVGATLPGGLTVKHSKIRGQASEGMLCSEEELGIGADASGIMILPSDLPLGAELSEALRLEDAVLDISITPNRSDCLSIVGVAREWAAISGKQLRYPCSDVVEGAEDIRTVSSVTLIDPDLCPRYTARIIRNCRIEPSPLWIRQRLEAVGLRPINNIVDVTNFVMMELGQPLHAFDFRYLEQGRIVVRRAKEGENFVSLDGKERTLQGETLLICDGVKPVAIGGVMGGLNSEVQPDTETILLESAYFNPTSIRKTSRELTMGTDAAFRFERGIDPEGVVRALNRAARLIAEVSGGILCRGVIDAYPQKVPTAQRIPLRMKRISDLLGISVPADEVVRILQGLEMQVERAGEGLMKVTPPTCRIDITREIDLVEEIIRLYGYDRVPATLPQITASAGISDARQSVERRLREIMTGAGYAEVINYSFISPQAVDRLGLSSDDERRNSIAIRNPLTEEQAVLRTTMAYSLLLNARKNIDSGYFNIKIFELGKTFLGRGEGQLPRERNRMACLITGLRYEDRWNSQGLQADFYDLKGCIESILDLLRIPSPEFRSGVQEAMLHPGKSCGIFSAQEQIGFLGEIHPDLRTRLDLTGTLLLCELDLDAMAVLSSDRTSFRPLPRFPASSRDVAFLVPRTMEAREVLAPAEAAGEELLEKVHIFDVYEGQRLPAGTKSLGLRFSYRCAERTLTDEEVNEVHARIVRKVVQSTGGSVR
jgi:phenylalanyl-tRNA synthetase beta chain